MAELCVPVEVSKTGAMEGDALDEGAFEVDVLGVCAGTEEEGEEGEEVLGVLGVRVGADDVEDGEEALGVGAVGIIALGVCTGTEERGAVGVGAVEDEDAGVDEGARVVDALGVDSE